MVLTSNETIHYFISTHLSYQQCDGLAMWRQRAFKPRKRKRCSLSPHSHTSYLYADKPKMKLQYNKMFWSEMEPARIFLTRPVNFKIYTRWPAGSTVFFYRKFLFTVQCIQWKIFKRVGGMGEVLKFVTSDRGLAIKTQKKICVFAKITQF